MSVSIGPELQQYIPIFLKQTKDQIAQGKLKAIQMQQELTAEYCDFLIETAMTTVKKNQQASIKTILLIITKQLNQMTFQKFIQQLSEISVEEMNLDPFCQIFSICVGKMGQQCDDVIAQKAVSMLSNKYINYSPILDLIALLDEKYITKFIQQINAITFLCYFLQTKKSLEQFVQTQQNFFLTAFTDQLALTNLAKQAAAIYTIKEQTPSSDIYSDALKLYDESFTGMKLLKLIYNNPIYIAPNTKLDLCLLYSYIIVLLVIKGQLTPNIIFQLLSSGQIHSKPDCLYIFSTAALDIITNKFDTVTLNTQELLKVCITNFIVKKFCPVQMMEQAINKQDNGQVEAVLGLKFVQQQEKELNINCQMYRILLCLMQYIAAEQLKVNNQSLLDVFEIMRYGIDEFCAPFQKSIFELIFKTVQIPTEDKQIKQAQDMIINHIEKTFTKYINEKPHGHMVQPFRNKVNLQKQISYNTLCIDFILQQNVKQFTEFHISNLVLILSTYADEKQISIKEVEALNNDSIKQLVLEYSQQGNVFIEKCNTVYISRENRPIIKDFLQFIKSLLLLSANAEVSLQYKQFFMQQLVDECNDEIPGSHISQLLALVQQNDFAVMVSSIFQQLINFADPIFKLLIHLIKIQFFSYHKEEHVYLSYFQQNEAQKNQIQMFNFFNLLLPIKSVITSTTFIQIIDLCSKLIDFCVEKSIQQTQLENMLGMLSVFYQLMKTQVPMEYVQLLSKIITTNKDNSLFTFQIQTTVYENLLDILQNLTNNKVTDITKDLIKPQSVCDILLELVLQTTHIIIYTKLLELLTDYTKQFVCEPYLKLITDILAQTPNLPYIDDKDSTLLLGIRNNVLQFVSQLAERPNVAETFCNLLIEFTNNLQNNIIVEYHIEFLKMVQTIQDSASGIGVINSLLSAFSKISLKVHDDVCRIENYIDILSENVTVLNKQVLFSDDLLQLMMKLADGFPDKQKQFQFVFQLLFKSDNEGWVQVLVPLLRAVDIQVKSSELLQLMLKVSITETEAIMIASMELLHNLQLEKDPYNALMVALFKQLEAPLCQHIDVFVFYFLQDFQEEMDAYLDVLKVLSTYKPEFILGQLQLITRGYELIQKYYDGELALQFLALIQQLIQQPFTLDIGEQHLCSKVMFKIANGQLQAQVGDAQRQSLQILLILAQQYCYRILKSWKCEHVEPTWVNAYKQAGEFYIAHHREMNENRKENYDEYLNQFMAFQEDKNYLKRVYQLSVRLFYECDDLKFWLRAYLGAIGELEGLDEE